MNRYKPLIKMFWLDSKLSLIIFWSILIGIFLLSAVLAMIIIETDGSIQMGAALAVYIYFAIAGFSSLKSSFGYAVGMNATRRDYYVSSIAFFIINTAANSLLYTLFYWVETAFVTDRSHLDFSFFSPVWPNDYGLLSLLWVQFIISLFLVSLFFMIACMMYRFGSLSLYVFLGFVLAMIVLMTYFNFWSALAKLLPDTFLAFSPWLLVFAAVCFMTGWLFIRKASVKSESN